ncbi:MAG: Fic family protein, partial [Deltaproteobacteria bacterium]|nr:Fic family protein [Deltaproteobacteria bacterium]
MARQLHMVYLAKGVLATTAIEGNTLTESQVLQHLEGKLELPPTKEYLSREIDNIIEACDKIATDILVRDPAELSVKKIEAYNKLVLDKLTLDESILPGQIRTFPVGVGGYRAAPAEDC